MTFELVFCHFVDYCFINQIPCIKTPNTNVYHMTQMCTYIHTHTANVSLKEPPQRQPQTRNPHPLISVKLTHKCSFFIIKYQRLKHLINSHISGLFTN